MNLKRIISIAFTAIFWLGIWFLIAKKVDLEVLFPSPASTFKSLILLAVTKEFWITCAVSVLRISSGLFIGAISAVILAGLSSISSFINTLLSPLLTVIKATPIASFIILALLWIGRDNVPTFITVLIVLPVVWSSVYDSIKNIDRRYLETGNVFGFTKIEKLRHIYAPSVFSSFLASFGTSVGLAWKAGVAAEVLCTPTYSIGTKLFESKKYIETPELFAWTATVIILSMIITKLLMLICNIGAERSGNGKIN